MPLEAIWSSSAIVGRGIAKAECRVSDKGWFALHMGALAWHLAYIMPCFGIAFPVPFIPPLSLGSFGHHEQNRASG